MHLALEKLPFNALVDIFCDKTVRGRIHSICLDASHDDDFGWDVSQHVVIQLESGELKCFPGSSAAMVVNEN